MLACFKRHKQSDKQQSIENFTMAHFTKDNISQALILNGGPGGSITLTDEAYLAIAKEVNVPMNVSASLQDLTPEQILMSQPFQGVLEKIKERIPLQSPRPKRKT
ncbi:MAG TPA: hypothetical protein PLD88_06595 [Candidatus Berkiella sp.]|nr:hypothetical protein [Candidatus Berkiella sp.]